MYFFQLPFPIVIILIYRGYHSFALNNLRRQSTVKPVLGTLINFMGMRKIWTRGKQQANKFMLGAATAYNLKKWLNYQSTNRETKINIIKKGLQNFYSFFFITTPRQHRYNSNNKIFSLN